MQFLEFLVGDQIYAIDLLDVVSIEEHKEIQGVPLPAPYIKGMVMIREDVMPVFDLAEKLCVSDFDAYTDSKYGNMLLVVEHKRKYVAMEITNAKAIINIEENQFQNVPETVRESGAFIKGLINRPEGLVIVLNKDAMLSENTICIGEVA